MTQEMLQDRVDIASSRLDELQKKADGLEERLADANSIEEMAELARLLTDVRSDIESLEMARQMTLSQLDDELTRIKSSGYKDAVKKMQAIKADNEKKAQSIEDTFYDLLDQIDELHKACREYDTLHRKHIRTNSPYGLIFSYGKVNLLYSQIRHLPCNILFSDRKK